MKASELIRQLQKCIDEKGDLDVFAGGIEILSVEVDWDETDFIAIEVDKYEDLP